MTLTGLNRLADEFDPILPSELHRRSPYRAIRGSDDDLLFISKDSELAIANLPNDRRVVAPRDENSLLRERLRCSLRIRMNQSGQFFKDTIIVGLLADPAPSSYNPNVILRGAST